jgi:hypothetical protein
MSDPVQVGVIFKVPIYKCRDCENEDVSDGSQTHDLS